MNDLRYASATNSEVTRTLTSVGSFGVSMSIYLYTDVLTEAFEIAHFLLLFMRSETIY